MYLDRCLEDRLEDAEASPTSRDRRSRQVLPVPLLASRSEFGAQLRRKLIHCRHSGLRPAVLVLAVDVPADPVARAELLTAIGTRLRGWVRGTDTVVQIGDRFGVYLQGDVARHAPAIRDRLRQTFQDEFCARGVRSELRPRFGLAVHPGTPISGVDLIGEAERAIEA